MPDLQKHGVDDVVLATWKQNCTRCHGIIGRGDGPEGRLVGPPDLTQAAWQKRAIDSEVAYAIKKGRGKMPAFPHLPENTIQGLVRLVRMLGSGQAGAQEAPSEGDIGATTRE